MEERSVCQVCFTNSTKLHEYQTIIHCTRCGAKAHRYCYLPASSGDFICDACQENFKGNCAICDNPGLLKRVEKIYAHPVCLLLSHAHMGNSAHFVRSFEDLSFMPPEPVKLPKRTRCQECDRMSSSVLVCDLGCRRTSHIYCALKSRAPEDSKGWSVVLPFDNTNLDFSDLFEHIVNRRLSHHEFLKKKLTFSKQTKRDRVRIYCQEHSVTIVECNCKTFIDEKNEDEQDKWIYCQGCCRWLHIRCVENPKTAQEAMRDEKAYLCMQCIMWKSAIKQPELVLPEKMPKLHIYDFIFINLYLERKNFQASPQLLEFALKIPILPGKAYVEVLYRKNVFMALKEMINIPSLRNQIEQCQGENSISRFSKICSRAKDCIFYMWWLCQGQMLDDFGIKKEAPFLAKRHDQIMDSDAIRKLLDLMIKFNSRFSKENTSHLSSLKAKFEIVRNEQTTKSIGFQIKEDSIKNLHQAERILSNFGEKLRSLLNKLKSKGSKQYAITCLNELHTLINSPEVTPYHDELPDIPIVQACIYFKKKQAALRYLSAFASLGGLKIAWKGSLTEQPVNPKSQESIMNYVNKFMQVHAYEEKDEKIIELIMKEWGLQDSMAYLPSKSLTRSEPDLLIPDIKFQGLSLKRINEMLQRFNQNSENMRSEKIDQFTIMNYFLEEMSELPFNRQSLAKMQEFAANKWQGGLTKLIPKIIQQFNNLFCLTEQLLSEHCDASEEGVCVFAKWRHLDEIQERQISLYTTYFQDIRQVRLDFFNRRVYDTLKSKLVSLLSSMQARNPVFESEAQFKLLSWWCIRLQVVPVRAGLIMERDRAFQQGLSVLYPNFQNFQAVNQLESFLTENQKYFSQCGLEFRVRQIRKVLTWIDIHKYIIQKFPSSLLLTNEQLQYLDNLQSYNPPDYFILKETLELMRKLKFPDCQFLRKFQAAVTEGERIYRMIERIFNCCRWGYDLSQQYGQKMHLEEFNEIYQVVTQSPFSFRAEVIELDIIKDKYEKAEISAHLTKIQFEKQPDNIHLQKQAQHLLISFGSFPISSKCTQFLWIIYERPKLKGLPENLQVCLTDFAKSHHTYSWQLLEYLQMEIQNKSQNRIFKRDYISRLVAMTAPCKLFMEKYGNLIWKFSQKIKFNQKEMEMVEKILQEEKQMQFCDEDVIQLRMEYGIYQYARAHIKNHMPNRTYEPRMLQYLQAKLLEIHPSFSSPEVQKYKTILDEEFHRSKYQISNVHQENKKKKGRQANDIQKEREKERYQQRNEKQDENSSYISTKMSGASSQDSNYSNRHQKLVELKTIPEKSSFNKKKRRYGH